MAANKTENWILAARPKTLPAAIAPVIIGCAMAWSSDNFHLLSALAVMFGALLIQIGTNFANDYFDFKKGTDTEDRLGPVRVTQAGLISESSMKQGMILVFSIAVLVGVYLVYRGGWPIVTIGLLSILFGILYTGGPFPLGYNGLGEIFVLIFFGPVAVGGTYYVQALDINTSDLIVGLGPGLFSVAILAVNNLRDIDSDKKTGKKTLAVLFGKRFAQAEFLTAIIIAILLPFILYCFFHLSEYIFVALLSIFFAIPIIKNIYTVSGFALNDCLAATGKLLFIYAILISIGLIL